MQGGKCLEGNVVNKSLSLDYCHEKFENQQWEWGYVNQTAMEKFEKLARVIH